MQSLLLSGHNNTLQCDVLTFGSHAPKRER